MGIACAPLQTNSELFRIISQINGIISVMIITLPLGRNHLFLNSYPSTNFYRKWAERILCPAIHFFTVSAKWRSE